MFKVILRRSSASTIGESFTVQTRAQAIDLKASLLAMLPSPFEVVITSTPVNAFIEGPIGEFISTIKAVRQLTRMGLYEAKSLVAFARHNKIPVYVGRYLSDSPEFEMFEKDMAQLNVKLSTSDPF